MKKDEKKPGKIMIINTGGTIAMETDEETDAVRLGVTHPLHALQNQLAHYAKIEMKELYNLPSPHLTPSHMKQLSELIDQYSKADEVEGIVVTHGTDTLEETAYFLDLTVHTHKPIILTGAMRSNNELGADGPVNLVDSVRTAAYKESGGRGTLVVFNNEIHAARHVTKTHTSSIATFQSPATGPLGTVTKKEIYYYQQPSRGRVYQIKGEFTEQVPLIKMVAGFNPDWLDFLLQQNIHGLVLEAFGAGNVPPRILPILETLIKKEIPVVMVSRCFNGYVQDLYDYKGGGRQLKDMGVIFCNGLNGQKARIKLLVLLNCKENPVSLSLHYTS